MGPGRCSSADHSLRYTSAVHKQARIDTGRAGDSSKASWAQGHRTDLHGDARKMCVSWHVKQKLQQSFKRRSAERTHVTIALPAELSAKLAPGVARACSCRAAPNTRTCGCDHADCHCCRNLAQAQQQVAVVEVKVWGEHHHLQQTAHTQHVHQPQRSSSSSGNVATHTGASKHQLASKHGCSQHCHGSVRMPCAVCLVIRHVAPNAAQAHSPALPGKKTEEDLPGMAAAPPPRTCTAAPATGQCRPTHT